MGFFIANDKPYEKEIEAPDGEKGTVTLRRLNAGDQAAIQDTLRMSISEDADASMAIGTARMLTVQRALINWSWPGPKPSQESISQLEPAVFEQIYSHVEIGTPPTKPSSTTDETDKTEEPTAVILGGTKKTLQQPAAVS